MRARVTRLTGNRSVYEMKLFPRGDVGQPLEEPDHRRRVSRLNYNFGVRAQSSSTWNVEVSDVAVESSRGILSYGINGKSWGDQPKIESVAAKTPLGPSSGLPIQHARGNIQGGHRARNFQSWKIRKTKRRVSDVSKRASIFLDPAYASC